MSEPKILCSSDLFEIVPALASRLSDDPAALSAVTAMMERAFFAGRIHERLERGDRGDAYAYRRKPRPAHKYAVSVLPDWLAA